MTIPEIVGVKFKCPYCGLVMQAESASIADKAMDKHIHSHKKRWWQ